MMTRSVDNPYVGPRTFEEKDARFFFGREYEARDLLSLVISEPLALFYAPSGAGKSSLINTRLIPGLRVERFDVLPIGRVSGELPAGITDVNNIFVFNLLLSLDQGREEADRLTHTTLADYLSQKEAGGQAHKPEPPAGIPLRHEDQDSRPARVLIIDQFEEILTAHLDRWQEREGFFRQLGQAISGDPLLWVVLTIREDYVAALDPYARLLPGRLRARFYMQRMVYQAALEATRKPAEQHQRPFAPEVAETLVDNLRLVRIQGQAESQKGQFVEPVQLQVVCYQLWENLKERPPAEITRQDLQELGDVDKALAQFYEQAIARVLGADGGSEIDLRNWFDHRLITESGTRGTVYQGQDKTGGLANQTVQSLANQFLLRAEIRAGGTWYELVHDRFVEPILQANRDWRLRQSALVQAAMAWDDAGRNEDNLYRGQQLKAAFTSVRDQTLEPLVREFLTTSKEFNQALEEKEALRRRELQQAQALAEAERQRAEEQARATRRLRRLAIALAMVFLLAVGAAIYARTQQQRAQAQEQIAQNRAAEAIAAQQTAQAEAVARATAQAQAETRRAEAEAAQSEAVAAQKNAEKSALIARSGQLAAQAQTAIIENYPQLSLLLAVEAVRIPLQATDVRVPAAEDILWQTLGNAGGISLGSHEDSIAAITISPDTPQGTGDQWLVIAAGTTARLWSLTDLAAGPIDLPVQEGRIAAVAISPDTPQGTGNQWLAVAGGTIVQLWNLADPTSDPISLPGHDDPITALAISPDTPQGTDSRWLVTGSEDGRARIWDLADLDSGPIILPAQESPIAAIAISPDTPQGTGSRWLITTGSFDTAARVWDLTDLDTGPIILRSGKHPITRIAISSDGRWLAGGSDDTYVWDLTAQDPAATPIVLPSQSFVNALAFSPATPQSPDNPRLVIGHQDATVHVWNLADLDAGPTILRGHDGAITSIVISADAPQGTGHRWLATGSLDRTVMLWDLANLAAEPTLLRGHDDAITALAISPGTPQGTGHRWLVTGSADRTARLWDLAAPSPATAAPIVITGHEGFPITEVATSPDTPQGTGNRWLVTASDDATLGLWDLTSADASSSKSPAARSIIPSGHDGPITALAISPDGHWLVTGGNDATARLWDLSGAPDLAVSPVVLTGHQGSIQAIAISPDSHWLVTGGDDTTARLWDLTSADLTATPVLLSGHTGSVTAIATSTDGHWLATAGGDRTVRLWDFQSLTNAASPANPPDTSIVLSGHEAWIGTIAISPDAPQGTGNRWLATGDDNGVVHLWNLRSPPDPTTEPIILHGHSARISAIAISPDSHWLVTASADGTARLWDLGSTDPSATSIVLHGHERSILAIAVSSDSHWLATGSFDGTARLWDLTAEDPAATPIVLRGHSRGIFTLAISPDTPPGTGNHWLVTGSADGTARLWTMQSNELVDLACRTAGRNLSLPEWAQYFSGQAYRKTCFDLPMNDFAIADE